MQVCRDFEGKGRTYCLGVAPEIREMGEMDWRETEGISGDGYQM